MAEPCQRVARQSGLALRCGAGRGTEGRTERKDPGSQGHGNAIMMRLCEVLRQYRWATKRTLRPFAIELGMSAATLSRIENGATPDGRNLSQILRWLLDSPEEELRDASAHD